MISDNLCTQTLSQTLSRTNKILNCDNSGHFLQISRKLKKPRLVKRKVGKNDVLRFQLSLKSTRGRCFIQNNFDIVNDIVNIINEEYKFTCTSVKLFIFIAIFGY